MSEQEVNEATEPNGEVEQGEPDDAPLGPNGEKALSSERDARKAAEKSAAELKARLDEIEQANLSELEKAQRTAEDAQRQLREITTQNLRNQVALEKGVPSDLVEFLAGDTEEEISSRADTLISRLNVPKTPRPDPSQGAQGNAGPSSAADQFAEFAGNFFTR